MLKYTKYISILYISKSVSHRILFLSQNVTSHPFNDRHFVIAVPSENILVQFVKIIYLNHLRIDSETHLLLILSRKHDKNTTTMIFFTDMFGSSDLKKIE